ncbi:hypothetical protein [Desulfosporosinus youngiae]|uniref:Uncharacterized protein n=1 Tax=Desulfosporosinus youngiae DSM 17734 TaxID=768710 RepID=H5Y317_9FIRM|nr:hypothetical protein [Desulfosporosinus youngiae]EHQ88712.1 hypothetical protein DesyoDRAFT_1577 [Desulfosporosinus youngiae DSM 17734]
MATTYERYLKLNIDGSRVGLGSGESESSYFCTPKGAKVIGWAGVDGSHYCFVRGFGEMVFAVSPLNTPGNYVHPVARNFRDFLRLLLACGDTAALEQVSCWEQAQFGVFLQDNPLTGEQRAVLDSIGEKLLLAPMEQPFAYIKELQAGFDYSRLKYPEDYYEWVPVEPKIPEWKVYFDGNFWGHQGRERAGKEISLHRQFVWEDEVWYIPAIYTCSKGLVVDFCPQVPAERIRSFMDKWNLSIESVRTDFSDEQRMQIDAENPLAVNTNPNVVLNGTVLSGSHGCGVSWNPCFPESNGLEVKSVTRHYGLDPAYGWAIWRSVFPWKTKRKPQIRSLSVTLMQEPVAMQGPHFHVSAPGERIKFTHPTTGVQHTLTVQEYERQEIPRERFGSQDQEFPMHYTVMSYTLSPDLPDAAFTVTDCLRSDRPRQKRTNPNEPQASDSAFSFGIIGGAVDPTAIIFGGSGQGRLHAVCSALHFEPVDDVEWRMVFHEKRREDITVELI